MATKTVAAWSAAIIEIKVCDDKFDFNTQDIDDFKDPFGIEFPIIDYYFQTTHLEDYTDFDIFYNTLKSHKLKEKFKDLFKAVGNVLYIEFVN